MFKFILASLLVSSTAFASSICDIWSQHPSEHADIAYSTVSGNNVEFLKELFTCGLTIADVNDASLLPVGILENHPEVTKVLLDQGADVNKNVYSNTPYNLLNLALNRARDPSDPWVGIAMQIAAAGPSQDQLNVSLGVSISAIAELLPDLTALILQKGANVNYQDEQKNDDLALSTLAGYYSWSGYNFQVQHSRMPTDDEQQAMNANFKVVLKLLLDHGADPNLDGWILYEVASDWPMDQLQLVLDHGANPNVLFTTVPKTVFSGYADDVNQLDCADLASEPEYLERLSMLLKAGADPNQYQPTGIHCQPVHDLLVQYGYKY